MAHDKKARLIFHRRTRNYRNFLPQTMITQEIFTHDCLEEFNVYKFYIYAFKNFLYRCCITEPLIQDL